MFLSSGFHPQFPIEVRANALQEPRLLPVRPEKCLRDIVAICSCLRKTAAPPGSAVLACSCPVAKTDRPVAGLRPTSRHLWRNKAPVRAASLPRRNLAGAARCFRAALPGAAARVVCKRMAENEVRWKNKDART